MDIRSQNIERDRMSRDSGVLRHDHVQTMQELHAIISVMIREAGGYASGDDWYDIVIRDKNGHEYAQVIDLEQARRFNKEQMSTDADPGKIVELTNAFEQRLFDQTFPRGNPHPIEFWVELRRHLAEAA